MVKDNRGVLTISAVPGGHFQTAFVNDLEIELSARWRVEQLPSGAPMTIHFWPRCVAGLAQYRFYVSLTPDGDLFAKWDAVESGGHVQLGDAIKVGAGYEPREWWRARVQELGSDPTTIRARVWQEGTPEPSGWTIELSDLAPGPREVSDSIRLGVFAGAGERRLPLRASFTDLSVLRPTHLSASSALREK